jgi:hypothetical protein
MSSKARGGSNLFQIATIALAVLVIGAVVVLVVVLNQLSKANARVDSTEKQVASLQTSLSAAETRGTSLQKDLDAANKQIQTLSGSGSSLQQTVAQQASQIKALDEQIKTMRYPRNFATPEELSTWLMKDNTNSLYPNPTAVQRALMAFILQLHAARDGFILSVNLPQGGNLDLISNRAVVSDVIYEVRAWDDFAQRWGVIAPAMPGYPIPPDSGQ